MSYPEARYQGTTGEINATFRSANEPPELSTTGADYHYLATTASTAGEFGLYRVDMAPRSGGPSTHFHKSISESFFVLSGSLRLFDGRQWVDGTAGDFLYVPVGGLHAFRNDSDEPMSMLMLFAPGAPREGYFEGMADMAKLSDAERAEFFIKHDSYWVDETTVEAVASQGNWDRREGLGGLEGGEEGGPVGGGHGKRPDGRGFGVADGDAVVRAGSGLDALTAFVRTADAFAPHNFLVIWSVISSLAHSRSFNTALIRSIDFRGPHAVR